CPPGTVAGRSGCNPARLRPRPGKPLPLRRRRRQCIDPDRFPPGSRWPHAHVHPRSRPVRKPALRSGATADRDRDIPGVLHAGPDARPIAFGELRRMEDDLVKLTDAVRITEPDDSDALLGRLTILAAELEAQAASSLFRFGASRAYYDIVMERLQALKEVPYEGADSWSQFLVRRVAPAMRTCRSVQDRQENLSRKLARTTQLLRTSVEVEVEKQNRNLLASMN